MNVLNRRIELPDDFNPVGDPELARRIFAAVLSWQQGVSIATGYKKVVELPGGGTGPLWTFLAAVVTLLYMQAQDELFKQVTEPPEGKPQ